MIRHVAIIGAGFSGTLQAINLLRRDGPRVTLIEKGDAFARGLAYSTDHPGHLLNVRASNMSAFADRPDHFVAWQAARGRHDPHGFAARREYGAYLGDLLDEAIARDPARIDLLRETVADITMSGDRVTLQFDRAGRVVADAAILALGNLPPRDPARLAEKDLGEDRYVADPWRADVAAGLTDEDTVLVLGTGLTMVDIVLMLDARGFRGRVLALSRRGLAPHAHAKQKRIRSG